RSSHNAAGRFLHEPGHGKDLAAGGAEFFDRLGLRALRRAPGPPALQWPGDVLRRLALRLARAETGASPFEWLTVPISELAGWCEIVEDEARLIRREMEKRR
ncbi:MAG: hypothetical protein IJR14_03410, partial [Synergistaceae bacterium]|nr:hypothetical protein [Synergistaceae bacterium]